MELKAASLNLSASILLSLAISRGTLPLFFVIFPFGSVSVFPLLIIYSPQYLLNPLNNLNRAERLGDELVSPQSQGLLLVSLLTFGRQHDDMNALQGRIAFYLLAYFLAVLFRHHDVKKHQAWFHFVKPV